MQIDELKRGLATLADEMEPFEGNVGTLHRRERRRRIVTSSIAIALVAILGTSAVVAIRHHGSNRVHVAGVPTKEVSSDKITHIDAIVVPATAAVKEALDTSPSVVRYALIPRGDRSSSSLFSVPDVGRCALQTSDGYAVDATTAGADLRGALASALAGKASVYDVADRFGFDLELFLKVDASIEQSRSMLAALRADTDIASFRYITRAEAYTIFQKDFADQPALVQSTKPSDLPESFRIILKPGTSVPTVLARYRTANGVDSALTPGIATLFRPGSLPTSTGKVVSPCAKP